MSNDLNATNNDGPTLEDICKPVPQVRSLEEETEFQRALIADMERLYCMNNAGELNQYDGYHVAMIDGRILGSGQNPYQLANRLSREHGVPEERIAMLFIGATPIIHSWG